MYTVGLDHLPDREVIDETTGLMKQALAHAVDTEGILGLRFEGIVYQHNPLDLGRLSVLGYSGLVIGMPDPEAFNLQADEAWLQVAECSCASVDVGDIFAGFALTEEDRKCIKQLGELAGVETQCPHYEAMSLPPNSKITIPFGNLGACSVIAVYGDGFGSV